MKTATDYARKFLHDEDAATLLEYGMLVLLIAVLCVVAIKSIGSKVSAGFTTIDSSLP